MTAADLLVIHYRRKYPEASKFQLFTLLSALILVNKRAQK
jgi:hypothetical protein